MNFDKKTTASFDVDAQNGFTGLCPDELPVPGATAIVEHLNAQAELAKFRVGSKDAHNAAAHWVARGNRKQFDPVAGFPELDMHWKRHCEVGTFGFELIDGLPRPIEYDYFVWKGIETDLHPYGACYHTLDWKSNRKSTGVIEFLKYNKVKTVIVGGLATDYCVVTTALQLREAGFEVVVNLAACRGIDKQTTLDAVMAMQDAGIQVVNDVTK